MMDWQQVRVCLRTAIPEAGVHRFWKIKLWPARVSEGYRLVVPELCTFDACNGSDSYF
jgi:hypothetical protein